MSSRFVFGVLAPAILVLAVIFVLNHHFSRPAPAQVVAITPEAKPTPVAAPLPPPAQIVATPAVAKEPAPVVAEEPTLEEKQAAIAAEKDRLYDWGMSSDPQSLSNILADLNSPDKEICMAAIEASKQFGSTNAIPVLKAAAAKTDDTDEAMAMLDAANFLSLPTGGFTPGGAGLTPEQIQEAQQQHAQNEANQQAKIQERQQAQSQRQSSGGTPPQ